MEQYLEHHGILGQRWGVRRFQNADGSLTKAGQKRYGTEGSRTTKQTIKRLNDLEKAVAYNKRDARDANAVLESFGKKYNKKFNGQPYSSDDFSKRDRKKASDNAKKKLSSEERIKEGQDEINHILKTSKNMNIKSWEGKYDTTRGKERITDALVIAGAASLGLIPGPNLALPAAIGASNMRRRMNSVDVKYYGEKSKEKAPSSKERRKLIEEAQKAEFDRREKSGKPFKDRSEAAAEYEKIADRMNNEWKNMKGYKFSKAERKAIEKRDNERFESNRLNAAEALRYSSDKSRATKYIKNMSDKDLVSEAKKWRESAEYHRKNGDKETAKEWEQNAKMYEKEINRRSFQ